MKKQILVLFLVVLSISGMAQKLPDWIINKPTPTNSTYLYVVESATGQTEMQARNRAIAEVFRSTAMRIGQPIDSEEINRALQRGTEYYVISSQYNVPINKVCEYTDNKTSPCRVYVLCQVAKAGNIHVEFDDFNACYEGANKYFADEALYADGFAISQNGKTLSDREIRTMFANSNSYSLYDEGKRIENMDFSTVDGLANWFGGISITAGTALSAWWIVALVNQSAANDAKIGMEEYEWVVIENTYPEEYHPNEYRIYNNYKKTYEEKTRAVEKSKNIAKPGVWLIGGGIALIVAENLMEKALFSSGKTKIRKAVNLYNNGRMYSQGDINLEYGLGGNGVYLTFSF
jgi:hypothetical protein